MSAVAVSEMMVEQREDRVVVSAALPTAREAPRQGKGRRPRIERNKPPSPTAEQFGRYEQMAHYFWQELFGGSLPPVLFNFSRKDRRCKGFYAPRRWTKDALVLPEISLNPKVLGAMQLIDIASVLVHELCHHWQYELGTPGREKYHNPEWAAKMELIGLMPSHTGEPGGKKLGQQMSHYAIPGGPFERAFQAIPAEYGLPWLCFEPDAERAPNKDKTTYRCPACQTNTWGKPGLSLVCSECAVFFDQKGLDVSPLAREAAEKALLLRLIEKGEAAGWFSRNSEDASPVTASVSDET